MHSFSLILKINTNIKFKKCLFMCFLYLGKIKINLQFSYICACKEIKRFVSLVLAIVLVVVVVVIVFIAVIGVVVLLLITATCHRGDTFRGIRESPSVDSQSASSCQSPNFVFTCDGVHRLGGHL